MQTSHLALAAILVSASACSPGPGRAPVYPDASEPEDGGFRDAYVYPDAAPPYDAGATDGMIALPDAAPRFNSDFTGVFGILNSQSILFAREVTGRINIVIDGYPYVYVGTINQAGDVIAESPVLTRAGCRQATITGNYDRDSATYRLQHVTCNAQGDVLSSDITGGFVDNFVTGYSGVFDLTATAGTPAGCFQVGAMGQVRYAMSFLPSGAMSVWTVDDVIATSEWYAGTASGDGSFSAVDPERHLTLRGQFSQATTLDPLSFVGLRDGFDPVAGCSFTITLQGTRSAAP